MGNHDSRFHTRTGSCPRPAYRAGTHALLLPFLALLACTIDNPTTAGGSTETVNGHTVAMLHNPDGSPAVGATVQFVPVDFRPAGLPKSSAAAVCSTTTDSDGRYSFASVPGGVYNIFGNLSGNRSFQDSVPVAAGAAEADPDTLRAPGTLRGYVDLSNGLDYKTVYALVFGSFAYSTVDSTGAFALRNLAEGDYAMRFFTTLDDWRPLDTVLGVRAGVDSLRGDTIRLAYRGIPVPTGLRLEYDTLLQRVTLRWRPNTVGSQYGYYIYRQGPEFEQPYACVGLVTDTVYSDSCLTQDAQYSFQVEAVDSTMNPGQRTGPLTVRTVSAFPLLHVIHIKKPPTGHPWCFALSPEGDVCIPCVGPDGSHEVVVFDSSGDSLSSFGRAGRIVGLEFNSAGNALVLDGQRDRVVTYSTNGDSITEMSVMQSAVRMAIGALNSVYVAVEDREILKYHSTGAAIDSAPFPGANLQGKVVWSSAGGLLCATDNSSMQVALFDGDLASLGSLRKTVCETPAFLIGDADQAGNAFLIRTSSTATGSCTSIAVIDMASRLVATWSVLPFAATDRGVIDLRVMADEAYLFVEQTGQWDILVFSLSALRP